MQTRITPDTDSFHAVFIIPIILVISKDLTPFLGFVNLNQPLPILLWHTSQRSIPIPSERLKTFKKQIFFDAFMSFRN